MNLAMLLDMAADGFGDRIAVGARDGGVTYADLRERARRVAAAVRERGAGRLVFASVNDDAMPALLFGAARAGVPYTAVNYRLADDRLQAVLDACAPATVVADEPTAGRVHLGDGLTPAPELLGGAVDAATGAAAAGAGAAAPAGDGESEAIMLFTSGTSGTPKRVLLRHRNLVSYVISTVEFMAASEQEAALVSVPPYHIAGIASVLTNTYIGRRVVYLPQFDAARWVAVAGEQAITHAMIVPTMLGRILDVVERTGTALPALRALSYGGGRMPIPVVRRAMELLPEVDFVNAYGLTETSSTICLLGPADHRAALTGEDSAAAARLGSVGRAVEGIELEIRDPEDRPLGPGEVGEIVVRGAQVSGEYDGHDAKDAGGWFHTNDTGRLDAEGYLFLDGRADDVIVRGGENLSPGEIEDVLAEHPAVGECAVVAIPDPEWGESPAVVVVLRDGAGLDADEVREWVRARLRSSRTPTTVVFRDALPYSDTGKLLRRELRGLLAEPAGSGPGAGG